jgi:putative selenate reductase
MTDKFTPTPIEQLLQIIIKQYDSSGRILGIPKELFFFPSENDAFRTKRFGCLLETPIGVAAGPHTQLSQNIIAAWLTGARYIELKTVQTLDELEVSKPCIDMQEEGYNCEWSQELKLEQSFDQYLDAWILIHVLKDKLNIGSPDEPGFIFNMSAGYNLEGILKDNVQRFLNKMNDASEELAQKIVKIKTIYPRVESLKINPCLSDNITLSTMHGCPPAEIEQIADYLITVRKLHTTVKLNPTLLGKEELQRIIQNSGFETNVPDEAFEHDLKYPDALRLLNNLIAKARETGVFFGVKLTNTLESLNHKNIFPANEKMMYASGKVLHPISVNVARKLQNEFKGSLDTSFSGGVDVFNINDVLASGLSPATVCSDLLKPGGYGRLAQYIEKIRTAKIDFEHKVQNLNRYADSVLNDPYYRKQGLKDMSIKTRKPLDVFDCAFAPCEETCPTNQGIPSYMYHTAIGEFDKAYKVIVETNPFANATGMICDHTCQTKCTRINYDNSLLIRDIKRFNAERQRSVTDKPVSNPLANGKKVSIIGAGPAGLSCAYFLRKAGFEVDLYETKTQAGGMVSAAVPKFRLTDEAVDIDIDFIKQSGAHIVYDRKITKLEFQNIKNTCDAIFIAAGAQDAYKLNIAGSESKGVYDPLLFLYEVKSGIKPDIGNHIVIIGGGNTAMDAARTAYRLCGENGKVTIVYRRTVKQMPAEYKEIKDTLEEGIELIELAAPVEVISENGNVKALKCIRMKLGEKASDGRSLPVEIAGSEFEIPCSAIIPAVGQSLAIDFIDKNDLKTQGLSYETKIENVFIGGDALRGASTLINAVGDGRKAAAEIIRKLDEDDVESVLALNSDRTPDTIENLMLKKAKRVFGIRLHESDLSDRKNFDLVTTGLTESEAIEEASRCLLCDEVCNICTTLCPNLALQYYLVPQVKYRLQKVNNGVLHEDTVFEVRQASQIIHIADWCNQCGNCETFCPTSDAPYKVKPHLYLNKQAFDADTEGYWFDLDQNCLWSNDKGTLASLKEEDSRWIWQSDSFRACLSKTDFHILEFSGNMQEEYSLRKAAEMSIIIKAAKMIYGI